jgi:hypothetical protein
MTKTTTLLVDHKTHSQSQQNNTTMASSKVLLGGALCLILITATPTTGAFSFVAKKSSRTVLAASSRVNGAAMLPRSARASSSLKMIDDTIIQGAGIAIAGLAFGVGLVAFTEQQGELIFFFPFLSLAPV